MKTTEFFKTLECEFNNWQGIPNTWPKDLKDYRGINNLIPNQTNASIQHILNYAVRHMEPGEIYLETGKYKGATIISALVNNDREGITVSDRSWDEGNQDKVDWQRNIGMYSLTGRTTYADDCIRCFFINPKMEVKPIGVLLMKNDTNDSAKMVDDLEQAVPYLADNAIIIMDNWNYRLPRETTSSFQKKFDFAELKFEALTSYLAGSPISPFWNGVGLIEWRKV